MTYLLIVSAAWLLVRSQLAMDAASAACRLFVTAVLPGLLPYMVATLMLVSRLRRPLKPWQLVLMGWCGGSPCGARLLQEAGETLHRKRIAAACAVMSPMFLLGTVGQWLGSARAGVIMLISSTLGASIAAMMLPGEPAASPAEEEQPPPLSLGQAVESAARTLLTVCGIMAVMRVAAALLCEPLTSCPRLALIVTTLLEVTTGVKTIAALPLPLALRTALAAAATGFGGASLIMQNRSVGQMFSLAEQIAIQALHGSVSFLIALGLMVM